MPKQRTPLNDVLESNKTARAESQSKEEGNSAKIGATAVSEPEEVALATEQPVPSVPQEKTSQYLVTMDNETGLPVKIEKLEETGERKELPQEEYEQAIMESISYYQGVADYLNNLT